MTSYELFKLLHVLGAAAWVGGGIALFLTTRQLAIAGEHEGLLAVVRQSQAIGNRLFMPAALVTIVFGVLLVATEHTFAFTDLWILLGFGGVILSGVIVMAFAGPVEQRIPELAAQHGADSPEVAAATRRVLAASAADLAVLVAVVAVMVTQPGF